MIAAERILFITLSPFDFDYMNCERLEKRSWLALPWQSKSVEGRQACLLFYYNIIMLLPMHDKIAAILQLSSCGEFFVNLGQIGPDAMPASDNHAGHRLAAGNHKTIPRS
jgi:hypothetical protein